MPWLNVLFNAWQTGWAIGKVLAGSTGQQLSNMYSALSAGISYASEFGNQLYYALAGINATWQGMDKLAPLINARLGNALLDTNRSIHWIVNGIIPATVKAATGGTGIGLANVAGRLTLLERLEAGDQKEIVGILNHIKRYVNPTDDSYNQWRRWWNKTGQYAWLTLEDWIKAPALLSAKLTPTITPDIVTHLAQPKQIPLLDRLLALLAYRAVDLPKRYPKSVNWLDRAAVAILQSGHYPKPRA